MLWGNGNDTRTWQGLLSTPRWLSGITETTFVFDGSRSSQLKLEALVEAKLTFVSRLSEANASLGHGSMQTRDRFKPPARGGFSRARNSEQLQWSSRTRLVLISSEVGDSLFLDHAPLIVGGIFPHGGSKLAGPFTQTHGRHDRFAPG